ncbi:hypothetical protein ACOMHN_063359 [Nucella lapillus]
MKICYRYLQPCEAGGRVEVKFTSYESTCEDNNFFFSVFTTDCDTVFEICIDRPGLVDFQSCSYDHQTSSVHEDNNQITFYGQIGSGISNPRIIYFNNFRERQMMLAVRIKDDEVIGSEDLVTLSQTFSFHPAASQTQAGWTSKRLYKVDGDGYSYTLNFQYRAYCDAHFYGGQCDVYCRAKDDVTGHYSCHPVTGIKQCHPGWEGSSCDRDINECLEGPCYNNAECVNTPGSYECRCPDAYGGKNCDLVISQCASTPCQHGGTCSGTKWSYSCKCPTEWTGRNCHIQVNPCRSNPCQHSGTCRRITPPGLYACICTAGWTGKNCNSEVNDCDDLPYQHGGTCLKKPLAEYECRCLEDYKGKNCELMKNPCNPQPCLNSGTCHRLTHDSYTCFCPHGWEGARCKNSTSLCNPNPCKNQATCNDTGVSYLCHCSAGWKGENCTTEANPCDSLPCQNGGICKQTTDAQYGYECSCRVEYEGKTCEELRDPCRSNPCFNGRCQTLSHSLFKCDCAAGWGGLHCKSAVLGNGISEKQEKEEEVSYLPIILGCVSALILVIIIVIALIVRRRRRQKDSAEVSTASGGLPPMVTVDSKVSYIAPKGCAEAVLSYPNLLYQQANLNNALQERFEGSRTRPPMPLPKTSSSGCGGGGIGCGEEEEEGAVGGRRREDKAFAKGGGGVVAWKKKKGSGESQAQIKTNVAYAENDYVDFAELQRRIASARQSNEDATLQGAEEPGEEDHYQKLNDLYLYGPRDSSILPAGVNAAQGDPEGHLDEVVLQEDLNQLRQEVLRTSCRDGR